MRETLHLSKILLYISEQHKDDCVINKATLSIYNKYTKRTYAFIPVKKNLNKRQIFQRLIISLVLVLFCFFLLD